MADIDSYSPLELGKQLMLVRDRADIKQAELARRVSWSAASLSRAESGERAVSHEELASILAEIGTDDAARLLEAVSREWLVLPRPALDHPDQALIWEAEQVAVKLAARRDDPDVRNAYERRLHALVTEIEQTTAMLLKREHQIAFVGSIGIGKSTAICRATGLEIPTDDGGLASPVLEAGAGGVTICEVHVRSGPGYGLIIEPRTDDEIRADVSDLAEYLLSGGATDIDDADRSEDAQQGISKEVERAIRNMAGLKVRRSKGKDGKTVRNDDARELAKKTASVRELIVEILARMELHKRDRRDVWYDASTGKPPLVWLRDTFELVNNGRHPEFTLPRRIEVAYPQPLLGVADLTIRILDTKGIDRTAARADLEYLLDDPHTVAVLCSSFNNAPAAEARLLLERARDAGVRALQDHVALLVLPRTGEAMASKDESGMRVETPEEGYELKAEQVALSLQPLGLDDLNVGFYNSHQDSPARLQGFLVELLSIQREKMRANLRTIISGAHSVLANEEREQVQAVIRQAERMFTSWMIKAAKPNPITVHVQDSLMAQMASVYASTIRATVRREGEWSNLSYSHHLGYGARRVAAVTLEKHVTGFAELCETMLGNPDYTEAGEMIAQAARVLSTSYDELLRKVQLMGQTSFRNEIKQDIAFWVECEAEWGQGPGYKHRVIDRNRKWFGEEPQRKLEAELMMLITREWQTALGRVSSLFDSDTD